MKIWDSVYIWYSLVSPILLFSGQLGSMESVHLEATTRVTDIGIQRKPSDVGSAAVTLTFDTF